MARLKMLKIKPKSMFDGFPPFAKWDGELKGKGSYYRQFIKSRQLRNVPVNIDHYVEAHECNFTGCDTRENIEFVLYKLDMGVTFDASKFDDGYDYYSCDDKSGRRFEFLWRVTGSERYTTVGPYSESFLILMSDVISECAKHKIPTDNLELHLKSIAFSNMYESDDENFFEWVEI